MWEPGSELERLRLETLGGSACALRGVAYPLSRSGHGENSAQGLVQSLSQAPRRGFSPAFAPLIPREDRHAASGAAVPWPRRASALAVTHRRKCGWSPTCCNDAGTAVALALWRRVVYLTTSSHSDGPKTGDDEINPLRATATMRARGFISSSPVVSSLRPKAFVGKGRGERRARNY